MGRKFASIHILDADIDEVSARIAAYPLHSHRAKKQTVPDFLDRSGHGLAEDVTESQQGGAAGAAKAPEPAGSGTPFYFVKSGRNTSVFSDFFSSGIAVQARRWFGDCDRVILAVDYFNDDYLDISVFRSGALITSWVAGGYLEPYGLDPVRFDSSIFRSIFPVLEEQLNRVYAFPDLCDGCEYLGEILRLPLTLTPQDLVERKKAAYVERTFPDV